MAENEEEDMVELYRTMAKRGRQANLSFFAFTATPKHKTLKVFGRDGTPAHRYTMRQAIEEGFILDVLKHYTTYATYFRLLKASEDDPNVERKKAARALARFLKLHPHNIAQKTEVMIEHFHAATNTRWRPGKGDGGTGSRLEAVRYKQSFDLYIKRRAMPSSLWWPFLVSYDDKVEDVTYTEEGMNRGIGKRNCRTYSPPRNTGLLSPRNTKRASTNRFSTQCTSTGGLQASRPCKFSRLNRTHPLKEDTFILDFVNDRDESKRHSRPTTKGRRSAKKMTPLECIRLRASWMPRASM